MATSVVIIGGGLMGLSAAFHLRRADPGVRVAVLERFQVGAAASGASAAGVRVMGRDPAERALALESLGRWPELDKDLEGDTGYRRGGGLRVALDEDAQGAAPSWVAEQRADGVPVQMVDAAETRRLAPGLSARCLGGVHCPIDGQADAMATVQAFAAAARRLGAVVHEGVGAGAVLAEGGRVVAVIRGDGDRDPCDIAIVAAGVWSAALLAGLGVELSVHARPLQMLLTDPAPAALEPVVSSFNRALSFKQLADGSYLIGGGWPGQIIDEATNAWRLVEDSVQASLEVAREVYPPVAATKLARGWIGLEAFTPDNLPVLGPVPGIDGLLVASGFSGHGFALAPAVGDVLASLALGLDPRASLWQGLRFDRARRVVDNAGPPTYSPGAARSPHPT